MRIRVVGTILGTLLAIATPAAAWQGAFAGSFRPYLHVFLAFAAAWLIIGAWVFRIGRKVSRLADRLDEDRFSGG